MKITLDNEVLIGYTRTDDAVKAFSAAVTGGQTRLALELLLPIVEALTSGSDISADIVTDSSTQNEDPTTRKTESTAVKKASAAKKATDDSGADDL